MFFALLSYFSSLFKRKSERTEKMISTSQQHAKHAFAVWNTQQRGFILWVSKDLFVLSLSIMCRSSFSKKYPQIYFPLKRSKDRHMKQKQGRSWSYRCVLSWCCLAVLDCITLHSIILHFFCFQLVHFVTNSWKIIIPILNAIDLCFQW